MKIKRLDAESIKRSIDLMALIKSDTSLMKVASTNDGEYAGSCPFCGGKDRFRVQPYHTGGVWYCRGCGGNKWHDSIDYIMFRNNTGFMGALKQLSPGGDMPRMDKKQTAEQPPQPQTNRFQWTSAAGEFLEDCQNTLHSEKGKSALQYLAGRGLDAQAANHWGLGYNPVEGYGDPTEWGLASDEKIFIPRGIVIPCQDETGLHYIKIRRRQGDPKYLYLKGSQMWPFGLQTFRGVSTAMLFEGEFDVMLAHSTGFTGVGYASLPAGQKLKPEYQPFFENIDDVIVALDFDPPGRKAAAEYEGAAGFFMANPLPDLCKDLSEYYELTGSIELVFEWLYSQVGLIGGNHES